MIGFRVGVTVHRVASAKPQQPSTTQLCKNVGPGFTGEPTRIVESAQTQFRHVQNSGHGFGPTLDSCFNAPFCSQENCLSKSPLREGGLVDQ